MHACTKTLQKSHARAEEEAEEQSETRDVKDRQTMTGQSLARCKLEYASVSMRSYVPVRVTKS